MKLPSTPINFRAWICAGFIFLISCTGTDEKNKSAESANNLGGLLPVVRNISNPGNDFLFQGDWTIVDSTHVENTTAYTDLMEGLQKQAANGKIRLAVNSDAKIKLVLVPGTIKVENAIDTNITSLAEQAYSLHLEPGSITISANATQGLYYGVQTFLQLLQTNKKEIFLPSGEISDWPDLSLRIIYWDDAHHLEKFDALKRIIRQASQYKINAFAIKLEGHFEFKSAPYLVEPYAISAAQYQELTNYAKKYFVELVPYLDAPAHVSFILKHPQYAKLRLYPDNNYEFSVSDTNSIALIKSMFSDLLRANQGGNYVVLSTDEAYYTGKGPSEKKAAADAGSNGKLLARFVKTVADELKRQGRTVIFWGEFPMTANDIPELPSHLINGEYNEMSTAFSKHGIRQLIYTYTQGEEPVFPNYYSAQGGDTVVGESAHSSNRVAAMLKDIRKAIDEKKSIPMGVIIAGWSDAGLHPETFWLGYTTGAAMAWNIADAKPADLTDRFFTSFYARDKVAMKRIYELLSTQAEFFDSSWDWIPSDFRKPILGNSEGIYSKPEKATDQSLPMLPVPSATNLSLHIDWDTLNKKRPFEKYRNENDELVQLINTNRSVENQSYNWEVIGSVAALCRQNLSFISGLKKINELLKEGAKKAEAKDAIAAVKSIDDALSIAADLKKQRDSVFASVSQTWYKEWEPLVAEANGRRFLHQVDDIKDHEPGRTIDLSYLIYRQLNYPLGNWVHQVSKNRNEYARKHGLPVSEKKVEWKNY